MQIRSFEPEHLGQVLNLWNRCLYRDPVSEQVFGIKVLADPNLDPAGCLVALDAGQVIGFALGLLRKVPLYTMGMQEDQGWITSFFVHPDQRREGVGSKLIHQVLDYLQSHNRKTVWFSSYTPNYFFPGVDLDAYPEGKPFLEAQGFKAEEEEIVGMAGPILNLQGDPEAKEAEESLRKEGIVVQFLEPGYIHAMLDFLWRNFSGDWYRHCREKLLRSFNLDEFLIVRKGNEVLGWCQYDGEHFGPFGVAESLRGRKLGSVLFDQTVQRMKAKGLRHIWVAWTGGGAKRFYEQRGMAVNRRHALMKLEQ